MLGTNVKMQHCHIAWHAGEGLAVQFLESESTILSTSSLSSDFASTCASWDAWYPAKGRSSLLPILLVSTRANVKQHLISKKTLGFRHP